MADYNGFSINLNTATSAGAFPGTSINLNTTISTFNVFVPAKWQFNPYEGKLEYTTKPYPLI